MKKFSKIGFNVINKRFMKLNSRFISNSQNNLKIKELFKMLMKRFIKI